MATWLHFELKLTLVMVFYVMFISVMQVLSLGNVNTCSVTTRTPYYNAHSTTIH